MLQEFEEFWLDPTQYALVKHYNHPVGLKYSLYNMNDYFFVILDVDMKTADLITDTMIGRGVRVFETDDDFGQYKKDHPVVLPPPPDYAALLKEMEKDKRDTAA